MINIGVFVHEIHITAQLDSGILTFVHVVRAKGHPRSVVVNPDCG